MAAKKPVSKKEIKKIQKDAVKIAEKPVYNIPEEKPTPEIEYIITSKVRYDVNWFYFKKLFTRFEKWLISPYRRYEKWFNAKFNKPKDNDIEMLFESIPEKFKAPEKLEDIIYRSEK